MNDTETIVGITTETINVDPLHRNTLLESALYLRNYGFNILPVIGKNPASFGYWTKLYSRPQTLEELEGYDWKKATGIAVILGTGEIHSLDIDDVKDESILFELLNLLGLPAKYEWVEKTGGGFQVFFLCPARGGDAGVESRNCIDGRADHFELRWKECISVVPPSEHYDKGSKTAEPKPDGKSYSWKNGMPSDRPLELEMSVVEKAYKALTKENPPKQVKTSNKNVDSDTVIGQAVVKFDMRKYLTAREINWWNERDGQARIEYLSGHSSLVWSDELRCSKFWKDGNALRLLDTLEYLEACKAGKEPLGYDALDSEEKQAIKDLLSKYSGVSLECRLKLAEPEVLIPEDEKFLSEVIFTADSIGDIPDPVDWIVKDVMATEECFGLFGLPGEGKSYAALQLAISVASGNINEWLGFEVQKSGPVLYILNDGSMRSLKNRIRNISNYLNVPKPRDLMVLKKQGIFKTWKDSVERIIDIKHPIMIVVDSLSMITNSKDENAVSEQVEFGSLLNEWSLNHKLNVLTIHHSNKGSVDRAMGLVNWRGSSYWAGMLSSMMEFRRVANTGQNKYKLVKSRDGGEDAMDTRECSYERGVRKDGSYDLLASTPPSGYRYIGKAEEAVPGVPQKAGRKKMFFIKLDEVFALEETKTSKQAVESIMVKYGCGKNMAIDTLKEWTESGDILKHKAKTGAVTYERKG